MDCICQNRSILETICGHHVTKFYDSVLRILKNLLRWFLLTLLGVYIVSACAMLVVRYAVLPNINAWRPLIERNLSSALDLDIRIQHLSANWSGLSPTLSVQGLSVADSLGKTLLDIPSAFAAVSWRSILAGDLRLSRLELDGLVVAATRLADGRLSIAGHVLDPGSEDRLELNGNTLAVRWLLGQGIIHSRGTTLIWNDERRRSPELELTNTEIELSNGLFSHRLAIHANLPPEVGKSLDLVVRSDHVLKRLGNKTNREAEIYLEMQDINPQPLRAWIDIPEATGRYAARAWIDIQQGRFGQAVVDIAARGIGLPLAGTLPDVASVQGSPGVATVANAEVSAIVSQTHEPIAVFANEAQIRLTGWLSDLLPDAGIPLFARSTDSKGVGITLHASGAQIFSPYFEPNLTGLGRIDLVAQFSRIAGDKLKVAVSRLSLTGPTLQLSLDGSWSAGGESVAGVADLRGKLDQLPVDMLHHYMPKTLPVETRAWMRNALIQGRAADVSFRLQGDLAHFPFNQPDAQGQFVLSGLFHDLSLDYDHGAQDTPGWPMLIGGDGKFSIDRMGFSASAQSGALAGPKGERVAIKSLNVGIADMELDPRLKLQTVLQADADAVVSLLGASPLAGRFGSALSTTSISGEVVLPINLSLNLDQPDEVALLGSVRFDGNSISFDNPIPKLESIRGSVEFTEKTVKTDDLKLRVLDGDARVSGSLGAEGKGVQVDGTLSAAGLLALADMPGLSVIDGRTTYQIRLRELPSGGLDIQATSPMVGLAVALPAPLGKSAEQRQSFSLRWASTQRRTDYRHAITVTMGDALNLRMERLTGVRNGPLFQRAALGIGTPVELPESGMIVEMVVDKLDWDRWNEHLDQFTRNSAKSKPESEVFPEIQRMQVRAANFNLSDISLTNTDLRMTQNPRDQWTAVLKSKETDATVSWRESSGALAGRVVARVSRLSIGDADSGGAEPPKVDSINESQWSDIPAVDLTIDDFVLYGNRLGTLHLQGSNIERGERWNIERLDIHNPHAKLTGSGLWTLKGADRGVRLTAAMEVEDLGDLSTFMGYPDRVREGSGTLSASVDWRNFPWIFSFESLDGEAKIDFKKGVFEHVNSRSARLLELLSLQSLSRLLRLDFRPGNEFQNGFPFTSISGDFGIAGGVVSTKNLVVASPIAEVLMVGNSDLSRKLWDMQASVKPIFDMSGAAVATGFAVNPLLGVGALVTQFLLRTPIERVMTSRYSVTGPWDDPKLEPLDAPPVNTSGQSNPSEFPNNQRPTDAAPASGATNGTSAPGRPGGTTGTPAPTARSDASGAAPSIPTAPRPPIPTAPPPPTPTAPRTLTPNLGG